MSTDMDPAQPSQGTGLSIADVAQAFHDLDGTVNALAVSELMKRADLIARAAGNENAEAIRASLTQLIELGTAAHELAPVAKAAQAALPVLNGLVCQIDDVQQDLCRNADRREKELSLTKKLGKVWQEFKVVLEARTIPVVTMQKIEGLRQSVARMLVNLRVIVDREESRLQTLQADALEAEQMRLSNQRKLQKKLKESLAERDWQAVVEIFPQALGTSAQLSARFQECLNSSDLPPDQYLALGTAFDLLSYNTFLTLKSQQSSEYPYRELQESISQPLNKRSIERNVPEQARKVEQFAVLTGTALFLEGGISASDNEWSSIFHGVPKNQEDTYVSLLRTLRPKPIFITIDSEFLSTQEGQSPCPEDLIKARTWLHESLQIAWKSYHQLISLKQMQLDPAGLKDARINFQNNDMTINALKHLLSVLLDNIDFDKRTNELLASTESRGDLLWTIIHHVITAIYNKDFTSVFANIITAEQSLQLIDILKSRQQ